MTNVPKSTLSWYKERKIKATLYNLPPPIVPQINKTTIYWLALKMVFCYKSFFCLCVFILDTKKHKDDNFGQNDADWDVYKAIVSFIIELKIYITKNKIFL